MRLLAAALAAAALLPLARCGPQDFKLVSVDAADSQARAVPFRAQAHSPLNTPRPAGALQ
jgi:hypothetical protein